MSAEHAIALAANSGAPNLVDALVFAADICARQHSHESLVKAQRYYLRALDLDVMNSDPSQRVELSGQAALVSLQLNDYAEAVRLLRGAVNGPGGDYYHELLIDALVGAGLWSEAVERARERLALTHHAFEKVSLYRNMSISLVALGDVNGARECVRAALGLLAKSSGERAERLRAEIESTLSATAEDD